MIDAGMRFFASLRMTTKRVLRMTPRRVLRMTFRMFDTEQNSNALLDVEYIFIFPTVGGFLFLLHIAVQVVNVDFVECLHKTPTHPAKSWVVKIAVIGDIADDSFACSFNSPLCKADKFHVVVLKPFRIAFAKRFSIHFLVVFNQLTDER